MYEHLKCGDRQKITPVEMPESTRAMLLELMRQNAMVVEANCRVMKLISTPIAFISDSQDPS